MARTHNVATVPESRRDLHELLGRAAPESPQPRLPAYGGASTEALVSPRRKFRGWWLAGVTGLLGILAGAGYASLAPQSYLARAYVLVVAQQPTEDDVATSFAQTLGRIAAHPEVIDAVAGSRGVAPTTLQPMPTPTTAGPATAAAATQGVTQVTSPGVPLSPSAPTSATADELRRSVRAATSPDAPVVEITGSADSPTRAADLANLVADSLVTYANERSTETRMRLVLLSPAYPPLDAAAPQPALATAVGAATGLFVGGFAMLAGLDRRWSGLYRTEPRQAGPDRPEPDWPRDERPTVEQPALGADSGQTVRP